MSEDIPLSLGCHIWPTRLGLGGTCFALPDSISRLSALRELDVAKTTYLSSGLAECRQLTRLKTGSDSKFPSVGQQ